MSRVGGSPPPPCLPTVPSSSPPKSLPHLLRPCDNAHTGLGWSRPSGMASLAQPPARFCALPRLGHVLPLPCSTTPVVTDKPPSGTIAGDHCHSDGRDAAYLLIPGIPTGALLPAPSSSSSTSYDLKPGPPRTGTRHLHRCGVPHSQSLLVPAGAQASDTSERPLHRAVGQQPPTSLIAPERSVRSNPERFTPSKRSTALWLLPHNLSHKLHPALGVLILRRRH
mmetsp:Transcript_21600/g.38791  ORF Transcript_21600/g.38791 Transcript_21600/m.38791 type:complete len:224 (+) Transcript_21600:164-835(+)